LEALVATIQSILESNLDSATKEALIEQLIEQAPAAAKPTVTDRVRGMNAAAAEFSGEIGNTVGLLNSALKASDNLAGNVVGVIETLKDVQFSVSGGGPTARRIRDSRRSAHNLDTAIHNANEANLDALYKADQAALLAQHTARVSALDVARQRQLAARPNLDSMSDREVVQWAEMDFFSGGSVAASGNADATSGKKDLTALKAVGYGALGAAVVFVVVYAGKKYLATRDQLAPGGEFEGASVIDAAEAFAV
jgi:hypothetical protein